MIQKRCYSVHFCGFYLHRRGGRHQRYEDADFCLLSVHYMCQVTNHGDRHISPAFDRDNGLFRLLPVWLEIDNSVNPCVRAFFLSSIGHRIDERHGPPLELILIPVCQVPRTIYASGCTMYLILNAGEGIIQPFFNERYRKMGDINTYPLPSKLLRTG